MATHGAGSSSVEPATSGLLRAFPANSAPAGNETTKSVDFVVDSIAPTTPVSCAANSPVNQSGTCTFAFNEPVTNVTCSLTGPGGYSNNDSSCVSPKVYASLDNGTYSFTVSGTDAAQNVGTGVGSFVIDIDTTDPETTINTGPPALTSSSNPSFTFSANETATFMCSFDNAPATSCASGISYPGTGNGPHTFSVYAVDTSGNTDPTPATWSFTVDTTPPATPTLTRTAPASTPTNTTTATLTAGSVESGATLQFTTNGGTTWTNAPGNNNPIQLTGLTNGTT